MRRYPQRGRSAARALDPLSQLLLRWPHAPVSHRRGREAREPNRLSSLGHSRRGLHPLDDLAPLPSRHDPFSQDVLQNLEVERLIRHDPLQPSVLLLERLQLSSPRSPLTRHTSAATGRTSSRLIPSLPANLRDLPSSLPFPEYPDDLLLRESTLPHGLPLVRSPIILASASGGQLSPSVRVSGWYIPVGGA